MSDDMLLNPPGKRPVPVPSQRNLAMAWKEKAEALAAEVTRLTLENLALLANAMADCELKSEVARLTQELDTVTAERDESREQNRKTSWMGEGYALVEARAKESEAALAEARADYKRESDQHDATVAAFNAAHVEGVAEGLRMAADEAKAEGWPGSMSHDEYASLSDSDEAAMDCAERIAAAILAPIPSPAKPADGWQPIATAPKDGTKVDLWCINHLHYAKKGERRCNVDWGTVTDWMGREREDWRHGHGEDLQPTHWMPLPAPPVAPAAGDKHEGGEG